MTILERAMPLPKTTEEIRPAEEVRSPEPRWEQYRAPKGPWEFLKSLPRRIFQHVFRSVPYPTRPRLIRIGDAGKSSPVMITTNYDLTVRRVTRALDGLDCWLLVAPAGGLDVWCAAGGDRFNVDSIISILKTSRIAELVDHRRLILPQLCANGINMFEVRRRTGWTAVFGPVEAADVPEYLETRKRTNEMMRVTYTVKERLEMGLAMWGSLALRYTLFPVLLFGLGVAGWFAGGLALLAAIMTLGCFVIPGKTFVQKALVIFLPGAALIAGGELLATGAVGWFSAQWISMLLFGSYLIGTSYPSYTPLWQCGYSTLFYGFPNLELSIIEDKCIGCKLCDQVCPVECFSFVDDNKKMIFGHADLCEGCMACLVQCPTDAIINEVATEHQRLSQCQ